MVGAVPALVNSDTEDLAPSNPFLHTPQRDNSRHMTLQMIQVKIFPNKFNRFKLFLVWLKCDTTKMF